MSTTRETASGRERVIHASIMLDATGERELRVGDHVAYGTVGDGTYAVHHAPTQADFDAVAAALDAGLDVVVENERND